MCGRFSLAVSKERVSKKFNITIEEDIIPNYNIVPTDETYIIGNNFPKNLQKMSWGLVPYWAKDAKIGSNLINARSEGIASKLSFRMPIRKRRCLVLADGFYEWRKEGRKKIPYRITMQNEPIIAMAGIWDIWNDPNGLPYYSFAILTTRSNEEMSKVHDRMPIILSTQEEQKKWLEELKLEEILNMMQTLKSGCLDVFPVSDRVNSYKNNEPELYQPIQLPPTLFD